jgi:hypothetical protein
MAEIGVLKNAPNGAQWEQRLRREKFVFAVAALFLAP